MSKRRLVKSIILLAFAILVYVSASENPEPSTNPLRSIGGVTSTLPVVNASTTRIVTNAFVVEAVDGDTLRVRFDGSSTTEEKIRLLGVNTPESVDPRRPVECFGKEASRFIKELTMGKRLRLEEDVQADNVDKYGRLLRNVFLEDGTDLNALLIKEGYTYAYVSFPQNPVRKAELRRLQDEAKEAERGLWNPAACAGMK